MNTNIPPPPAGTISWKQPAIPRSVVQIVPIDRNGMIPIHYRTNKVRSAKNVWSFPSGLHDIGETMAACAARELAEEWGYEVDASRCIHIGTYENIAGDPEAEEQYHWVISMVGVRLKGNASSFVNNEPEKHTTVQCFTFAGMCHPNFFKDLNFTPSLVAWWMPNRYAIGSALAQLLID